PAVVLVQEADGVDGAGEVRLANVPGFAPVAAMQQGTARPPGHPYVRPLGLDAVEIAIGECCWGETEVGEAPFAAAIQARHDEAAIADGETGAEAGAEAAFFQFIAELDALHRAAGERVDFGIVIAIDAKCAEPRPGAGKNAVHPVAVEVDAAPAGHARPGHRLPRSPAVRRAEHAGWEGVAAVAANEAVAIVQEANRMQSRQHVEADFLPLQAAIGGLEHDADGWPAAGRFDAADDPAGERVLEVDAAQASPRVRLLALPVRPAVQRIPDGAVVADRPAFLRRHELDGVDGGVFEGSSRLREGRGRDQS